MPVLDGFAAARLLKASSATRLLKVIAYTARPAAIDPPLTKFFDDVLAKPASNADIVAFVRRFL
jgi:CheY-like chemotaxis protein